MGDEYLQVITTGDVGDAAVNRIIVDFAEDWPFADSIKELSLEDPSRAHFYRRAVVPAFPPTRVTS